MRKGYLPERVQDWKETVSENIALNNTDSTQWIRSFKRYGSDSQSLLRGPLVVRQISSRGPPKISILCFAEHWNILSPTEKFGDLDL